MTSWIKRLLVLLSFGASTANALPELQVGQPAPDFELLLQDGTPFKLSARKGLGWTVLYFYPKADTPGCTKQACAYRDGILKIREENAEVFGISTDAVQQLADFHTKYHLKFGLLSDPTGRVTEAYGAKMPLLTMAKRWTFLIDPEGLVRDINSEVDPALDPTWVVDRLRALKASG